MHSDQTGDDCVPGTVEALCTGGHLHRGSGSNGLDFAVGNHDRLVFLRRRARSIDDSNVIHHKDRCVDGYKWRDAVRILGLRNCEASTEEYEQDQAVHRYTSGRSS